MKESRLPVRKTYKLYVGGKFVRGESGRHLTARSAAGAALDHYCRASRKDFRDAVVAARAAQAGWAKATAYLRGQIDRTGFIVVSIGLAMLAVDDLE